jgi:hypothetical protein
MAVDRLTFRGLNAKLLAGICRSVFNIDPAAPLPAP